MTKNLTSFNPQSGKLAAQKRWEAHYAAIEGGIIKKLRELTGQVVSNTAEAAEIIAGVLTEQAYGGSIAAIKELGKWGRLLPEAPATVTLQAELIQIANVYDRDTLGDVVEYAPDHASYLLESADWNGAEEWKTFVQERLHADAELE